jgi:amino acid adenylation domain-containing protein
MSNSTVARSMAVSGASARAGGRLSATAAIPKVECRSDLPLSFAQERLWFLAQIEGGSKAYQNLHGLQLRGELDRAALRRALNQIVARHEPLRTVFALVDGKPLQRVAGERDSQFQLIEHDLRQCHRTTAELDRLIAEEASTPMDLQAGPLIRGRLIRHGNEEYVLLITIHHIVSDAWSFGVFSKELSALYRAYVRGEEGDLPELEIQYADYAVWQRKRMEDEVLGKQAEYWKKALAGAPEVLQLPADRTRPEQQSYSGAAARLVLDEELTAGLKGLSRKHRTTLYMTVLAGWAALLARLSGQDEVVIGTPVANRNRVEIERLIGFFVNTLALRLSVSNSFDIGELLAHVKSQAVAAQEHQGIPFEQVVEMVRPPRSLAHNPVFQVMFAWNSAPKGMIDLAGLQVSAFTAVPHDISKFDLTLLLQEESNQIVGELEYATALYERSTIERYLGYFRTLLGAMVADDSYKVDRLPILPQEDRQQLLYEWNATEVEYPRDKCVHELFEEQVARTPDAIALVFEGKELNYAQLNAKANQLARYLREQGVKPDSLVALCVERSLEMVIGILGIVKAGGAYVPVDPTYPAERIRFMIEASEPVVLLTQNHLENRLQSQAQEKKLPVLRLDADGEILSRYSTANLRSEEVGLKPEHLVYVIYTSGSTGRPNGVMNEHAGVVNGLLWARETYKVGGNDRFLQKTPYSFDVSVWEFLLPLLSGAQLVLARPDGHMDPEYLTAVMEEEQITAMHFVPPMLQAFLDYGATRSFPKLHLVLCSGEALPYGLQQRFAESFPGVQLHNLYGPTEAAVHVTRWICQPGVHEGIIPIGRPIANTQIYILDGYGEPVPQGVAGELFIGGAGVARGYVKQEELTRERFVADPFSPKPGARMYKTGDLARWLRDGAIEYLGRNDFQVKVRGFRIELGEIEQQLSGLAGVQAAVVLAREDVPGEKRLVAYYTAREQTSVGAQELRAHLATKLPEYMVPSAYVKLESLPLTANGKLNRKALPAPEGDAYVVRQYEAPQGAIEELLAGIWAELLKLERVGRHDNFFELGGHSLMAVTLVERLARAGLKADVRALFATPTLAGLATTIGGDTHRVVVPPNLIPVGCQAITPEMLTLVELSQEEIDEIVKGVPGGAANIQDIYPLAPLQEGILFHHLIGEGDPYVVAMQFAFETRTLLERYITALQAVIDRHDILRTAVVWEGLRERVQVVWRRAELAVEEIELDCALGDAREQLYARCHPRRSRIDVRHAPLLRLCIGYDSIQDRWLMVQLLHHLAGDHTTLEVMYGEVQAHLRKEEASLPEPLPFRNLVAQARLGVSQEEHEAFFRQMLGNVEETTAPFGLLDVQGDGSGIEDAHLPVEEDVARRLRRQARRLKVSVASLCHLAWAQVLARLSEREDVVFGTVLFGRMQGGQGADRVMGLFINTLPVRIRAGDEGVEASVRRVHSLLSDLLGHEHASLALVQRCSQVTPPAPLFSALLNYRHTPTAARSQGSLQAWEGIEALRTEERTNYPLTLSVSDFGEGFSLAAQTLASIGPLRICRYMHTALASLVEALETCPTKAVRALEILPRAERRQLLYEWNDTKEPFPSEKCIHELFEEQVEKTPEAVALVFENECLSYAGLNQRANQLAQHLRELGVRPDDRVAICAERGLEMVVGLLATLKGGGAYVPLDPAFPAERLRFMIEDSAPVVLLTQTRFKNSFMGPGDGRPIVLLDVEGAGWMKLDDDRNPKFTETRFGEVGVTAQNLACIIYTSGSTGTAKGVAVQHGGIVNLVHDWTTRFGNRVRRDGLQASLWTSFGFDVSIFELFAGFYLSATVNIVPEQIRGDLRALSDWFVAHRIAFGYLPPFFIRDAQHADPPIPPLPLELVLVGVEPSMESALYQLQKNTPGLQIVNGYGPAETTVFSTTYPEINNRSRNTPIGRPLANTRIYILDAHGEPVPVGVTGELYIGGAGVARGYLSHPELTAERFVRDPFTTEAGTRMYRTGDMGRWLADGNIEFLGRNDFQVKIRGFRIELGEIEARLREHEGVQEAVVVAREDTPGDKRLVAYYTAREQNSVGAQELRAHVKEKLPEYMVPVAYVKLESLPLTANGKLNRKALPAPEGDAYVVRQYEAPQGAIEELLAGIWAKLLKLERVGRHDNFFELGGHSLMAVTLVERLARAGLKADVRALFTTPTLAELAASFDTNAPALETPANRIPTPQKTTSSSRIVELSI